MKLSLNKIKIKPNPNLKKPTKDYGKILTEALKRQKS